MASILFKVSLEPAVAIWKSNGLCIIKGCLFSSYLHYKHIILNSTIEHATITSAYLANVVNFLRQ